ncbi:MAG: transcriptional regulator, IclR family protein [Tistrella sp.]|uniref:IclR family transcriptional regulator n=1 Tax=Tistrella mobilis TaxID=171437 RepID=A0A3B9IFK5_9PROT|nr:IclR family transcriptional regulator [Tistrella sp.]MAD38737.1 transcriptional regulator, IclR family protein [Tistrella sp.]MBA76757.1 transcriptional regulator, IclR family protein [Tistrella sp.]HAE46622.1 IclR family transcriptional regulator [Tistrella mobilis]|tara:strand:- start:172 stop:924 length:753 start_codon:yes stop_codon:yes gene_type:complete
MAEGDGVVKSAGRVLGLLQVFAEHRRPMRVSEIAQAMGIPQSSTSMLLKTLTAMGYVSFDAEAKAFRPTLRVALLGAWLNEEFAAEGSVDEMMVEMARATADTVILAVENGVWSEYIHVVQSEQDLRYALRPGTRRPLSATNLGRVLLAAKPDDEIERIIRRINAEAAAGDRRFDIAATLEAVHGIRRDGYSFTHNLISSGASVIALPMPVPPGYKPMAIGIGGPTDRLERGREMILAEMRRLLSQYLGG